MASVLGDALPAGITGYQVQTLLPQLALRQGRSSVHPETKWWLGVVLDQGQ